MGCKCKKEFSCKQNCKFNKCNHCNCCKCNEWVKFPTCKKRDRDRDRDRCERIARCICELLREDECRRDRDRNRW